MRHQYPFDIRDASWDVASHAVYMHRYGIYVYARYHHTDHGIYLASWHPGQERTLDYGYRDVMFCFAVA